MASTIVMIAVVIIAFLGVTEALFTSSNCYHWSNWGSFSSQTACNVPCGMGTQVRQRTRVCYRPGYRPPSGCRFGEVEKETSTCDSGVTCDGTLGMWTAWVEGTCSQYCGYGKRQDTRTRTCTGGVCAEALSETRTERCLGLGGFCRFQCRGYRSFLYSLGNPTSHACLRGVYQAINCPAMQNDLISTCGRDYVRCQVYYRIERYCARTTPPAPDGRK